MRNNEELDIAFLSGLIPKEIEADVFANSKGFIQNAANNFQWNIFAALNENLKEPPMLINSMYIGAYPKLYKRLVIKTQKFGDNNNHINVGFINIRILKNYFRYFSLRPHLYKWLTNKSKKKKIIIAYAMTKTFTNSLKYIKKKDPTIKTCLVVPDLPEYMNLDSKKSIFYRILKSVEIQLMKIDLKYVDYYILLTENMKDYLNIKKPYLIIEGITSDSADVDLENISRQTKRMILYTGSLAEKYGVKELVESFKNIQLPDIQLVLCGSGELDEYIKNESLKDKRIVFRGLIARHEVLELQKQATILVNPRRNEGVFTKYSFPSKLIEYMASGTPVVAYKLDGVPNEYYKHIYVADDYSGDLYETLVEVLSLDINVLFTKGLKAKEFIKKNKSPKKQGEKIIELLNSL